jgi:hypothetical protein
MQALDDSFLQAVGLGDLPDTARTELKNMLLERLEIQVGKRLTDQMSEQQLDEFETMMPSPQDSESEALRKEQAAFSWLEKNFPNYKQVVAEEIEKIRAEVSKDAVHIRQSIQSSPSSPASPPPIAA